MRATTQLLLSWFPETPVIQCTVLAISAWSCERAQAVRCVTMESIVAMYQEKQPLIGPFEQVKGFLMPLDPTTSVTPFNRLGTSCAKTYKHLL